MKLFPGKDKKSQKNLAIMGGMFFALPSAFTVVDVIGLLATDQYVPEDVLLGTLVAALMMSSLAGAMIYYGVTGRGN